jgi:integrase
MKRQPAWRAPLLVPRPLTDALIRGLRPPAEGRLELADAACRGLWLRVTASGTKSFAFRYRARGARRVERLTLGKYPDVSLRDARARADKLRAQIAAGKNPSAHKREASARSFAALAERYVTEHARRHKRSAAKDERNLRLHILSRWANRDFASITRADVIALIERLVGAGKPTLANHVHRLVSGIFSFAMDVDLATANPAARLRKRGAERVKTRVLNDDEIRLFWTRAVEPPLSRTIGLALRVVLATGCRPGEAAGMAHGELEFDGGGKPTGWTIPPARSKNGRAHFVPLSPLASDLIIEAMALAGSSNFVFASRSTRGHINNSTLATAMAQLPTLLKGLKSKNGTESWCADPPTPHDLRRSCATRLSAAGVAAEDVSAILGHIRADVTGRHYDHYRRADEKRRALERWARILASIIEPASAAVVVPLR